MKALSEYILSKEPGIRGYSSQNIWRMKQFYETYKDKPELSKLLRENTWSNNLHIISKTKSYVKYEIVDEPPKADKDFNDFLCMRMGIYNKKHTKGFRPKRGAHDALRQCQKGYWRMAQVLNSVIINKIIAKLGYISMLDYYLTVCEN